jgi:hypothetical protein
MNEITLNLIVLVVLLVGGVAVLLFMRRRQEQAEKELVQLAEQNGWKFESVRQPLKWGIRLSTSEWTLEALSVSSGRESESGSSNISMSTIWRADSSGSTLFIGERTSQVDLGGFGNVLVRQALSMALGADADGMTEIHLGSQAFQQRFMVWSRNELDGEKLITPKVESLLMNWRGTAPLIKRTSDGLRVELRGIHLKKANDIIRLVDLGIALVDLS